MLRPASLLAAVLALSGLLSNADTLTLTPSADTCLFERDPGNNWGAEPEIVAGVLGEAAEFAKARVLLKFDIAAALPAGATITGAQLRMTATRTPPGAPATSFQLLRSLASWEEGIQDGEGKPGGAPAGSGETTWNYRFHPSNTWASPGGGAEVDFAEDPSATQLVSGNPSNQALGNSTSIFQFNPDGIADLNSMLAAPSGNFGWILLPQNETVALTARRWASREHDTNSPSLEITFTPPPPPPPPPLEILDAQLDPVGGALTVTFASEPGKLYDLETRPNLSSGNWSTAVSDIAGAPGSVTVSTTPPAGTKLLFFRIRRL